jgi:hypothetical protein
VQFVFVPVLLPRNWHHGALLQHLIFDKVDLQSLVSADRVNSSTALCCILSEIVMFHSVGLRWCVEGQFVDF